MRLWVLLACALLIISVGHLMTLFQETEPAEAAPYEMEDTRHIMYEVNPLPLLCDLLMAVLLISAIRKGLRAYKLRRNPKMREKELSLWSYIGALGLLSAFGAILYVSFIRRGIEDRTFFTGLESVQSTEEPTVPVVVPGPRPGFVLSEATAFDQFILIMLSLIVVVLIFIVIVLMIRQPEPGENPILVTLPEFVRRRTEFTFDGKPREVVINAYGAALYALHKKNIRIPEHFTPWEFQETVQSPHLYRLTQLFEKARYSVHNITRKDAEEAVKQYRFLREEEFVINDSPESA